MKTFKLIKRYPSLHHDFQIGMFVVKYNGFYIPLGYKISPFVIHPEYVEGNPEFWEESEFDIYNDCFIASFNSDDEFDLFKKFCIDKFGEKFSSNPYHLTRKPHIIPYFGGVTGDVTRFTYNGTDNYSNDIARLTFDQFKYLFDKPKRISFYVMYSDDFTEDLYDKLNEWCKSNSKGLIRGFNDTYSGLKNSGFYVFDNYGLNGDSYYPDEICGNYSYGVDNNTQGCLVEYSVEDIKSLIDYHPPISKSLEGRYLKVINNYAINHYPCRVGDYLKFVGTQGCFQYWGAYTSDYYPDGTNNSRYFGIDVDENEYFELMPEGFEPESELFFGDFELISLTTNDGDLNNYYKLCIEPNICGVKLERNMGSNDFFNDQDPWEYVFSNYQICSFKRIEDNTEFRLGQQIRINTNRVIYNHNHNCSSRNGDTGYIEAIKIVDNRINNTRLCGFESAPDGIYIKTRGFWIHMNYLECI